MISPRNQILMGVSAAAFIGPFSQTIYAPSLIEIGHFFAVNSLLVNLTISLFVAILAMSGFIIGPLADHYGRRRTLLPGLALFIAGSLLCLLADRYGLFLLGRALQAFGISAGVTMAAIVIADVYPPNERMKAMSIYQFISFLGPVFGPVAGGLVAAFLSWQWAFGILAVGCALVLAFNAKVLPETLPSNLERVPFQLQNYFQVLRNHSAVALLLVGFSQFYGYYSFLVFLPHLIETHFQLSITAVGFTFLPLTVGLIIGISLVRRYLSDFSRKQIVSFASIAIALNVLVLWVLLSIQILPLMILLLILLAYGALLGTSLPAQTTILVNLFTENRGTAVGLYNSVRFSGAASGPLIGAIVLQNSNEAMIFLCLGILLLLSAWIIRKQLLDPSEVAR